MKKLSKILHARRHHDRDQPRGLTRKPSRASLQEAPTLHQLTSTRRVLTRRCTAPVPSSTDRDDDAVTRTADFVAGGQSGHDGEGGGGNAFVCSRCAEIGFPTLMDWQPGQPRPWVSLSHVLRDDGDANGSCPYCSFFRAMLQDQSESDGAGRGTGPDPAAAAAAAAAGGGGGVARNGSERDAKFAPYLRIRLAFERLGVREKHALGRSVLIEVMARSKGLPWGYIVKAADDDGTSMAGYSPAFGKAGAAVMRGRRVTPLLDPALARTWLDFCRDRHASNETCAKGGAAGTVPGLRLIDVRTGRLVTVQAVQEGEGEGEAYDYVTLSYVWGKTPVGKIGSEAKPADEVNGDAVNGDADADRDGEPPASQEEEGVEAPIPEEDVEDADGADEAPAKEHVDGPEEEDAPAPEVDGEAGSAGTDAQESAVQEEPDGDAEKRQEAEVDENKEEAPAPAPEPTEEKTDTDTDTDSLPSDLPPLIADALKLTADLGYRYLWIDRYCLPERSSGRQGDARQEQLDLMGDIFSRSALTVIVAGGSSHGRSSAHANPDEGDGGQVGAYQGIPGVSVPREPQLTLTTARGLFTTTLLRPDLDVADSAWASRAWTYQEGLLARRRLVLTPSQAYFQCGGVHCHESLSVPLDLFDDSQPPPPPADGDDTVGGVKGAAARRLNLGRVFPVDGAGSRPADVSSRIQEYMDRRHVAPSDRYDAFRGMLQHFRRIGAIDNLVGLPLAHPDAFATGSIVSQTDRLAVALGWRVVAPHSASNMTTATTTTTMTTTATSTPASSSVYVLDRNLHAVYPSWTWLAWRAPPGLRHQQHQQQQSSTFTSLSSPSTRRPTLRMLPDHGADVAAPPCMELSVGFDDGTVLSWEIDGDAIARRPQSAVEFLRVTSYTVDMVLHRNTAAEADAQMDDLSLVGVSLPSTQADAIKDWYRAAVKGSEPEPGTASGTASEGQGQGDARLTAVIVSGTSWKIPTTTSREATILVCRTVADSAAADRDRSERLIRLGALAIPYATFSQAEENAKRVAGLDGIILDDGTRTNLSFDLREVDIY
ncbi:Heterokaryon incompatibility protein (HET) [Geosmithia morbida]|uniref:Heterokaryon incompatibility protein (HET) n=1 Tax=Geosmithia morbida TaxID=1094350 RepID=A0A9P5D3G3_9HYPO|nr:Heterokaryon incompatibility protein (HET) [Geosmithia morbida]KAF4120484.1 Heterokaryon incompatibility protein (HET) [Geosmithia morbida]